MTPPAERLASEAGAGRADPFHAGQGRTGTHSSAGGFMKNAVVVGVLLCTAVAAGPAVVPAYAEGDTPQITYGVSNGKIRGDVSFVHNDLEIKIIPEADGFLEVSIPHDAIDGDARPHCRGADLKWLVRDDSRRPADRAVRAGDEISIIIQFGADDTKFRIDGLCLKRNADLVQAEYANALYPPDRDILPPKKQASLGVYFDRIQCGAGMSLMLRPYSYPACVSDSSVGDLLPRGFVLPGAASRVYLEPIQCGGNPYDDYIASFDRPASHSRGEHFERYLRQYYDANHGVATYGFVLDSKLAREICLSCSCKDGTILSLLVGDSHVPLMADLGFTVEPETLEYYHLGISG